MNYVWRGRFGSHDSRVLWLGNQPPGRDGRRLDSRWPALVGVGFVPKENLVGKAQFVGVSWRAGADLLKPWTWLNLDLRRFLQRIR